MNNPGNATNVSTNNANNTNIALQLYTIRGLTAEDMLGTLRNLASQGYRAVEFAGYGGVPVADVRSTLNELNMQAPSAHIGLDDLLTRPQEIFSDLTTLGASYAIVAYTPEDRRQREDQVREIAQTFNNYGRLCRDAGLRFAYHNHNFEFETLANSDKSMFDILLEDTDPELVAFELDLFWATFAGADPLQWIQKLEGRVPLVHVKDMEEGEARRDAPVGEGIINWQQLLPACAAAGTDWYIIEQDHPRDPLRDVETSLTNLTALLANQ